MTAERIRIAIGTEPKTEIARKVLEFSITRRTEMKVDFFPMIGKEWEYSTSGFHVGTGFSLRRWMVPAFFGWEGRAIYLDADQLVFGDVWDLWRAPAHFPSKKGTSIWCTWQIDKVYPRHPAPQTSVMVIDCAAAKEQWCWHIDQVLDFLRKKGNKAEYHKFMHAAWMVEAGLPPAEIPVEWNHLNVYDRKKTKLLHYTKEDTQPWYDPTHPYAQLWQLELTAALGENRVTQKELRDALGNYGKREDWRPTNGLHPDYERFLDAKRAGEKPQKEAS